MATTNDLKNGLVMVIDGQLWQVSSSSTSSLARARPRAHQDQECSIRQDRRQDLQRGLKIETATVDRRDMTYLYQDGTDYVFMDQSTYEQINVPAETVGDARNFMVENQDVIVSQHDGTVLFVELPATVVLTITHTEPGLQGDRSSAGTKPATLETGYEIQVPLFMEEGTRVKVDTRDGSVLGPRDRVMSKQHRFTSRTKARKRAADVVYEADQRGMGSNPDVLRDLLRERRVITAAQTPLPEFSIQIIAGVADICVASTR